MKFNFLKFSNPFFSKQVKAMPFGPGSMTKIKIKVDPIKDPDPPGGGGGGGGVVPRIISGPTPRPPAPPPEGSGDSGSCGQGGAGNGGGTAPGSSQGGD